MARRTNMTSRKTVLLKGELHSSDADLREEKALLADGPGVDVLVLEQRASPADSRLLAGWFFLSIALLAWILESVYHPTQGLCDLAAVQDIDVVYTRPDDAAPLETASTGIKAVSAGLFYTLIPGSLWMGFVTRSQLLGSLLLFLGLVLPVLLIRLYNTNRPDGPRNRDRLIATTVAEAGAAGDVVLAIVGAGHLAGVERWLREDPAIDVETLPPAHDLWSIRNARSIGVPMLKAGFVLFSLYVLCAWIVGQAVAILTQSLLAVP